MRINLGLAAMAIALSLALWVLVVNDQNPERIDTPDISIPVEITKIPSGMAMMSNLEPVRVRVRAPKDRWTGLRATSFRASVDLSRLSPGIQVVPVIVEPSDPQVHIVEVIPGTVSVRLEEIQERTVPVKVNLVGNVPFGYLYGKPRVDPEVVVISGPSSLVQNVETAVVDLRLEGITVEINSAFHPTPVDQSGASVRNVQLTPQTVKVTLPVDQQVSYKQVGVRAAISGSVAQGYWIESVSVEPASAAVVGDPKVLAGVNYLDTAPLNVNGATASVVQDLRVVTPQGASLVQQQTVRVRVSISQLQNSQVLRIAPRVVNLDPRLQASGLPAFVEVTLQGPATALKDTRIDSVGVTLNAAELGAGTHVLRPNVSTPVGIVVSMVDPVSVSLTLTARPTSTPTPTPAAPTPTGTPAPAAPSAVATPPAGASPR